MSSAFNIPAGYALVPVEPTTNMEQAASEAYLGAHGYGAAWIRAVFAAMLRAAPTGATSVPMSPGESSGWTRSAIFQAAKACAAHAFDQPIANSSSQKFWQGHADNLNAIVDAIDAAAPPVDAVPGEPVASELRAILQRIIKCDDDAVHAYGNPKANLNGMGLADLFDMVGHPFGAGPHKLQPSRSNELDYALDDARKALATPMASRAVVAEPEVAVASVRIKTWPTGKEYGLEGLAAIMNLPDGGHLLYTGTAPIAPAATAEPSLEALRKRIRELGYSDTAIKAMGDDTTMMQRSIDADPAGRAGVASLVAGEESGGRLGTLDQLP